MIPADKNIQKHQSLEVIRLINERKNIMNNENNKDQK